MDENIKVSCCGQCPCFEAFFEEYEAFAGRKISKGRCLRHPERWDEEPLFETSVPCFEFDSWYDRQN